MLATFWKALTTPVFASLLARRRDGLILLGVGVLQMGLHLAGLPGWQCPIKAATGIPCPGCGLTAATGALLHGDWREALRLHAFAPLLVFGFGVLAVVTLLPEAPRQRTIAAILVLEQRTGIMAWVLLSLIVYWGFRLPGLI